MALYRFLEGRHGHFDAAYVQDLARPPEDADAPVVATHRQVPGIEVAVAKEAGAGFVVVEISHAVGLPQLDPQVAFDARWAFGAPFVDDLHAPVAEWREPVQVIGRAE